MSVVMAANSKLPLTISVKRSATAKRNVTAKDSSLISMQDGVGIPIENVGSMVMVSINSLPLTPNPRWNYLSPSN